MALFTDAYMRCPASISFNATLYSIKHDIVECIKFDLTLNTQDNPYVSLNSVMGGGRVVGVADISISSILKETN